MDKVQSLTSLRTRIRSSWLDTVCLQQQVSGSAEQYIKWVIDQYLVGKDPHASENPDEEIPWFAQSWVEFVDTFDTTDPRQKFVSPKRETKWKR